jgi:DNA-binding CsgD family transcriptional regulator
MLFLIFTGHTADATEMKYWYGVFLACALLIIVICVFFETTGRRIGIRPLPLLAIFLGKALVKILVLLGLTQGTLGFACVSLDILLSATVYVVLGFMWTSQIVALRSREGVLITSASFLLSFLLQRALATQDALTLLSAALLPLISALCWYCAQRKERWIANPKYGNVPISGIACSKEASISRPSAFVFLVIAFLLAGSIIRGMFSEPYEVATIGALPQDIASIAFALLIFLACFFLSQRARLFQIIWLASTSVFFASLFLMALFSPASYLAGQQFVVMGKTCLCLLLMMILADFCRKNKASTVRIYGIYFLIVDVVSSFLGYIIAPAVRDMSDASLDSLSPYLSLTIALTLIVACIVFSSSRATGITDTLVEDRGGDTASGLLSADPSQTESTGGLARFKLACRGKGLTAKETEVAILLSQGYSQRKIAELTFVAIGTTQTHVKSIYRKFDIHSKQSLIDLVNESVEKSVYRPDEKPPFGR